MDEVVAWANALRGAGTGYQPDATALDACRRWLEDDRNQLLLGDHPHYPERLRALSNPPLGLFCRGEIRRLNDPQIAIVGSRNATAGGTRNAEAFAEALAAVGLTITSGLALGIDAAAHRGALKQGVSIAVLGSGLEQVYPRQNEGLAETIAERGALVSEYPPHTPAAKHHFPERNRIIAALSLGTLVVEAAGRSGALITARLAGEAGREVFAIPGSIHNPLARGCHRLLREGATLVEGVEDILRPLATSLEGYLAGGPTAAPPAPAASSLLDQPEYDKLLKALGFDPLHRDELIRRTGLTSAELSSMLLILELEGLVEALPGGRFLRLS